MRSTDDHLSYCALPSSLTVTHPFGGMLILNRRGTLTVQAREVEGNPARGVSKIH